MEIHPPGGESIGDASEDPTLDEDNYDDTPTPQVVFASLKPTHFSNGDDTFDTHDSRTIVGTVVKPTHTPAYLKAKLRGRKLAIVLRVEFDPACINLSYVEKAKLAGLEAPDDYQLVKKYKRILDSVEFVAQRRTALQAFESEMDVSTAVCLAEAAKRDPQFAVLRRRLRQWDERRMIGGDQREQFAHLMRFLHGETNTLGGNGNVTHEQVAGNEAGRRGLSIQDYTESDGLGPTRSPMPKWGEDETSEE